MTNLPSAPELYRLSEIREAEEMHADALHILGTFGVPELTDPAHGNHEIRTATWVGRDKKTWILTQRVGDALSPISIARYEEPADDSGQLQIVNAESIGRQTLRHTGNMSSYLATDPITCTAGGYVRRLLDDELAAKAKEVPREAVAGVPVVDMPSRLGKVVGTAEGIEPTSASQKPRRHPKRVVEVRTNARRVAARASA